MPKHRRAFPTRFSDGMLLRDYFAGQALNALVSLNYYTDEQAAEKAYKVADSMVAQSLLKR